MNMTRRYQWMMLVTILACLPFAAAAPPSAIYEEWRRSPAPADGSPASMNPPSLQWASVKHWEGRDVRYRVELSDDPAFAADHVIRGEPQRMCFFNPHKRLHAGTWYWRYEILDGSRSASKGPYSFTVRDGTPVFESPAFDAFLSNVPKQHPRVVTLGRGIEEIRKSAAKNPLARGIIDAARKAVSMSVYNGPLSDKDPARARSLERQAGHDVALVNTLANAYILTGEAAFRDALLKRLDVLVNWPTNDLLGSQVLTALTRSFDALDREMPEELRRRVLAAIEKQLKKGLAAWPGNIEGRQVENHFWQMELSANFTAAMATSDELAASREMLQYTYELFLARFPNLATQEGGWAEGLGYFGVNKSAVVDMALLLKHVGRADVFQMPWYRSLPDYFIYFAPIGGRIDGFGDMHDRVGNGDIGAEMMFVIGHENNDPRALYRAAAGSKSEKIDPWYRLVCNIPADTAPAPPADLPQARVFPGVGLAALHTSVLDTSHDTAVYFRSSPFGAKGHMHANQNAFNLSRRGEPLFYSTGYYTSFADAHSMSSYRHTRAHNSILVNGLGQAFGHEGYGWIKRFLNGGQIAYVCGDATMAYRPTVDKQFLDMLAESKIAPTPENGHGDAKLKLFERHLILIRPDTVVIYDVLESEVPSDWTLLLHTMKPPTLDTDGRLNLATAKNTVSAFVIGSQSLNSRLADQFHSPPVDIKKKYKDMPAQYHIGYRSKEKSRSMRFLNVLQMADAGAKPAPLVIRAPGVLEVGSIRLRAALDADKPAALAVETDDAGLYVDQWPERAFGTLMPATSGSRTVLLERNAGKITTSTAPDVNGAVRQSLL